MPSLSQAFEHATVVLYRLGDSLDEIVSIVGRFLPRKRLAQPYDAILKGVLWTLASAFINDWAGNPSILQLLYLVPVWLAFESAGIGVAAFLAAVVVPVGALTGTPAQWGILWDLVVRGAMMGSLVLILVHHSRRFRNTQESAQRDGLTGALNRRGFEEAARAEVDAALAGRGTLTMALIDCDHFKDLNDIKGHAFGDQVLKTLVRSLTTALPGAIVGRTGGDEFVLVDRKRNATELRRALAHAQDRYSDATLVMGRRASFTVGIATLGEGGMRYESLMEAADRDMYRGKFARAEQIDRAAVFVGR